MPPPPAPTTRTRPPPSAPPTPATPTATACYCESLPCPCAGPGAARSRGRRRRPRPLQARAAPSPPACSTSASAGPSYPNIRRHFARRPAAAAGRARWCSTGPAPTPAATGFSAASRPAPASTATSTRRRSAAARARASSRGSHPRGWKADVALRPQLREPLARLGARHQAAALLRRHPLPLRLLLMAPRGEARELGRRRVRRPDRGPDRHRRDRRRGDLAGGDRRPVRLDAAGGRDLGGLRRGLRARAPLPRLLVARRGQPRLHGVRAVRRCSASARRWRSSGRRASPATTARRRCRRSARPTAPAVGMGQTLAALAALPLLVAIV